MVSYRGIVSIVSFVVYVPSLGIAVSLACRRTLNATLPAWIFLILFYLIRIIGSSLQLATESASNRSNTGLYVGAAILQSVGLSPILLAVSALLDHIDSLAPTTGTRTAQIHRALTTTNIPITVALVLSIVGGCYSSHGYDFTPDGIFKAGIILFVGCLVTIATVAVFVAGRAQKYGLERGERYLLAVVLLSMPLITVRLVFALIFAFGSDPRFGLLSGDETIQLCMQVLEEYAITLLYLSAGFVLVRSRQRSPVRRGLQQQAAISGDGSPQAEKKEAARKFLRYVPIVHWFIR